MPFDIKAQLAFWSVPVFKNETRIGVLVAQFPNQHH